MNFYKTPEQKEWKALLERPVMETVSLEKSVRKILLQVKSKGDKAVKKFTQKEEKYAVERFWQFADRYNSYC